MLLILPNGAEAPYVTALRQEVPELVCFAEYCPIVRTDSADVGKFYNGREDRYDWKNSDFWWTHDRCDVHDD
jgi:hypothetical protein